jgi:hypothetical protein
MGERAGRTCHTSIQLAPYDSFSILRPARRVLTFLEDRRVLRNVSVREDVENCVQSVLKIREYLTAELSKLDSESELGQSLRAMRAACRKFLDKVQKHNIQGGGGIGSLPIHQSAIFNGTLGEMRGVFGMHVTKIASSYGLDVSDELVGILPNEDSH